MVKLGERSRFFNTTINLSAGAVRQIDVLVGLGYYGNRSEGIRSLIDIGLKVELGFLEMPNNAVSFKNYERINDKETFQWFLNYIHSREQFSLNQMAGEFLFEFFEMKNSNIDFALRRTLKLIFSKYLTNLVRQKKIQKLTDATKHFVYGWTKEQPLEKNSGVEVKA